MPTSSFTKIIKVLYEDDQYVAFEKPAGLLVIPTPKNEPNTLIDIVNHQYRQRSGASRLHPCHRLDKETSGAILFAKSKHAQQQMMEAFRARRVKKEYVAFVQGAVIPREGQLTSKVRSFDRAKRKQGREAEAVTAYEVVAQYKLFGVVKAWPLTGRSNQIRIHFKDVGHPLVGDRKYSFTRDYEMKFRRAALHAAVLEFVNPITRQAICVTSALPQDMEVFLARHRN